MYFILEKSYNGYLEQRIKHIDNLLKMVQNDKLGAEINVTQRILKKIEDEIAENKSGTYWILGTFTALDINLAAVLYQIRYNYN